MRRPLLRYPPTMNNETPGVNLDINNPGPEWAVL